MMPDKSDRREMVRAYKERVEVGGLYRIVNTVTGFTGPVAVTPNLRGIKNRLAFSRHTKTCFDQALSDIWEETRGEGFEIEEIERLERKPEQTAAEFAKELKALLDLYLEKE